MMHLRNAASKCWKPSPRRGMIDNIGYFQLSTSTPNGQTIPLAAQVQPGKPFDPVAATNAYLATLPANKRAASDAYFEGGYWITLWTALIQVLVLLFLMRSGLSRGMRDRAEK